MAAKYDPAAYVELAEKGLNNTEIGDALDVSESSVRRGLKKAGYVREPQTKNVPSFPESREVAIRLMPKGIDRLSALEPGSLAQSYGDPDLSLKLAKQRIMNQIRSEANVLRQAYVTEMTAAAEQQLEEAMPEGWHLDHVQIPTAAEYLDGQRPRPHVVREWVYGPDGPGGETRALCDEIRAAASKEEIEAINRAYEAYHVGEAAYDRQLPKRYSKSIQASGRWFWHWWAATINIAGESTRYNGVLVSA